MRAAVNRVDRVYNRAVLLTGGINESVSTMELNAGELIRCTNYTEVSGPYGGYISCRGYEVYDGTALASSVDVTETYNHETGVLSYDDTAREARRTAITAVPGSGTVNGVWIYNGVVYAVRNAADGLTATLRKATGTGWSASLKSLSPNGFCRWVNARFSKYPAATPTTNQLMLFMVDGVSQPISYDGTTVRTIDHVNLPSNADFTPAPVYPTFVGEFENRLFLVYRDQVFFSVVGDATDFDSAAGAGQIPLGDEVTNVILAPGNALVFILRNSIKILYTVDNETPDFSFQMKEFSKTSGGLRDTAARVFGDIFFADDRGPTTLQASQRFGDFSVSALTVKTQRTFLEKKDLVTEAVASRADSQYRIYFSDGTAIYYTLHNGQVKGAGYLTWPDAVRIVSAGEDAAGSEVIYFASTATDGFVYKMDSGTSFNGEPILTALVTSFDEYGNPRAWKHFKALSFQISAENRTVFYIKTQYDYETPLMPKNIYRSIMSAGQGATWGGGV